ncbi:hypothetical protein DOTSEDRAFT_81976 [Dothistroma septosporum NZE10]|uniref:Uncharacterized protein n=1 Tax=Dothistroma septosporum (strain NZE10 / CBS 128990) TaxID=675120 RepID=N1PI21_DOTSN|nr:hypothetical protein DOTSEDRAFT_81976 [Dothistroma septosporum NZE10]
MANRHSWHRGRGTGHGNGRGRGGHDSAGRMQHKVKTKVLKIEKSLEDARARVVETLVSSVSTPARRLTFAAISQALKQRDEKASQVETSVTQLQQRVAERHQPDYPLHEATVSKGQPEACHHQRQALSPHYTGSKDAEDQDWLCHQGRQVESSVCDEDRVRRLNYSSHLEEARDHCKTGFRDAERLSRAFQEGLNPLRRECCEEVSKEELEEVKKAMVRGPGGIATHSGHLYRCAKIIPLLLESAEYLCSSLVV